MRIYRLNVNGENMSIAFIKYTSALAKKIELQSLDKKSVIKIIKEE